MCSSAAFGSTASHTRGWIQSGFMTCWCNIRLQPNLLCYVLVGSRFVFVCLFLPLQIPNLKTPTIAHERDFILQPDSLAKFLRQNKATLPIRNGMLGARMQLAQKNAAVARGNPVVCLRG